MDQQTNRKLAVNHYNSENFLRPVNGSFDKTGRIRNATDSLAPIYARPCEWPEFHSLPPPTTTKSDIEGKDNEFYSR